MGQEIRSSEFSSHDFRAFSNRLKEETSLLLEYIRHRRLSQRSGVGGFELEAWLVNGNATPAPINEKFLQRLNQPLVVPELASFNVEINSSPRTLRGDVLHRMAAELTKTWEACRRTAATMNADLLMIGIPPSLRQEQLSIEHMSSMTRYHALNEQILRMRQGRPLQLDIRGKEHLCTTHEDVMLEAACTSFQIHLQVSPENAVRTYNAAIIASAPMVAACANSLYLFGHELWDETRIPLFEQAIEIGSEHDRRVTFGNGYVHGSLATCFEENASRYPVLLPMIMEEDPSRFSHLRLHNGTIWRWNRPLIGFDPDGTPHIRIEHRVVPAGPSVLDCIANAAMFFGLIHALSTLSNPPENQLEFPIARSNFYLAAREGLHTKIQWLDRGAIPIQTLLIEHLLPMARKGLEKLEIDRTDIDAYTGIIEARVHTAQNGAEWQRRWVARHGNNMNALNKAYHERQNSAVPVHEWGF
ncbi:MAG: glutamate--cysteine ligase [Gammaproteobacteria bacterium]|nr:glutamate--cysteine ligase [Gammaproteobacteria bacterium]MCI0591572.1 glutamate--cysteine ligase [Gammaproteobacteria bacterium]